MMADEEGIDSDQKVNDESTVNTDDEPQPASGSNRYYEEEAEDEGELETDHRSSSGEENEEYPAYLPQLYPEMEQLGEYDQYDDILTPPREPSEHSVNSYESDGDGNRRRSSDGSKSPQYRWKRESEDDSLKQAQDHERELDEIEVLETELPGPYYNNDWVWDGERDGPPEFIEGEIPGEYDLSDYYKNSMSLSPRKSSAWAFNDLQEALLALEEAAPPRKESEEQFYKVYMETVPPNSPTPERRLSAEALGLSSRQSTPSPPGTPKKTLRRMHECPSVESFLKLGDPVRVHFVVLPGQKILCVDARMDRTIMDLKKEIGPICKVPAEYLDLRKNRNLVMDYKTLRDLGAKPRRKMKFTVEISKRCPDEYVLKIPEENLIKQLPTVARKVRVRTDKGWKMVKVNVEFPSEAKPFIGGYRDKKKNVYYHNAITQTPFLPNAYSENVAHFSGQTFDDTWKKVQTLVDTYQQTTRPDYYISATKQKKVYARVYVTAEQVEQKRIQAAIVIQKYWRRWLAKRERASRLNGLIKRIEWAENIRKGRTESRLAIKEDEMWRQNHPARMVDVELLYRAINEWRSKEVEYINQHRWGADRKAALAEIMEKEADLLLDLERTKSTIRKNMRTGFVEKIFHKMGDPTKFLNKSGNFVALDNKEKHDMRQYHKLYHLLQKPVVEAEKRLDILEKIRDITKVYPSRVSKYLSTLIDREKDLMDFNAGPRLMVGLRQRVLNSFYHLLRDPDFNPEAKKLQKVPFDSKKLRKDMVQCKGCRKMQYREHFTVVRGVTVTTRCSTCMGLYRTCILRSDLNLYRRMLSEIRHDEQTGGVESSVTYLIDAYDLQFLIEQLWHGQSALSGINDRYLLRLCRWKRDLPWTPWNCVLLTEEEAVAHLHLDEIEAAYQPAFIHKVDVKHQVAKIYFARLSVLSIPLDPYLNEMCEDLKKGNKNKLKLFKARQKKTTEL